MGRGKKYQPEQVVNLLREIEVAIANEKTTALASKQAGIVEQAYVDDIDTYLHPATTSYPRPIAKLLSHLLESSPADCSRVNEAS